MTNDIFGNIKNTKMSQNNIKDQKLKISYKLKNQKSLENKLELKLTNI